MALEYRGRRLSVIVLIFAACAALNALIHKPRTSSPFLNLLVDMMPYLAVMGLIVLGTWLLIRGMSWMMRQRWYWYNGYWYRGYWDDDRLLWMKFPEEPLIRSISNPMIEEDDAWATMPGDPMYEQMFRFRRD